MSSGLRSAPVYDPVLRLLHWSNALLITILLISGWLRRRSSSAVWQLIYDTARHRRQRVYRRTAGTPAVGLDRSGHARWRSMWQPQAWMEALRSRRFFIEPTRFGHHPVASLAYLLAYALMLVLLVSGLMLLAIKQGHGR